MADIVKTLVTISEHNGTPLDTSRQVGIIVPFRGQIAQVRKALEDIGIAAGRMTIDTVERYQGSQRDIILYGTTINCPCQLDMLSTPISLDGKWIDRKLNVALTRARKQFFLIGNEKLLKGSASYRQLLERLPTCPGFSTQTDKKNIKKSK